MSKCHYVYIIRAIINNLQEWGSVSVILKQHKEILEFYEAK